MAAFFPATRNRGFLEIPDEVLDIIFQKCDAEELRMLRLVSSKLENFAASRLFRIFTLYPHMQSFKILSSVARSDRIRHHVRTLLYDARWRGIVAMVLAFLSSDHNKENDIPATREAFTHHVREIDSQALQADNVSHQLTQMGVLEDVFRSLISLQHIQVNEGTWARIGELSRQASQIPYFYLNLIRGYEEHLGPLNLADSADDGYSPRHYPCALSLLAAARMLPANLESFKVNNTDWHACFDQLYMFKYPDVYAPGLRHVKNIEFSLGPQQCRHIRTWTIMENLQNMLQMAVSLEDLTIVLRNDEQGLPRRSETSRIFDNNHRLFVQSMFQLAGSSPNAPRLSLARLTWGSRITQLTIQGLVCTMKELKSVLSYCAHSLRELNIASLILLPETPEGSRACLVKQIKWIESNLRLDRVSFDIYMTNGGSQNWYLKPDAGVHQLHHQVMRFMIRDGLCPLDHVEIPDGYFDLGMQHWNEDIPWMLMDESFFGDETWDMRVPDLEFERLHSAEAEEDMLQGAVMQIAQELEDSDTES